jgi:hypothetical protein
MSKLVQAAAQADEKKKHEMAEVERKKLELHGGHGTSVDISYSSFSYESSSSSVMSSTIANMKRMHELDQHRCHELEERVRLLEH